MLGLGTVIEPEDLSMAPLALVPTPAARSSHSQAEPAASSEYRPISLEQLEKEHIMATLAAYKNNKSRAAIVLGVERSTLDRKLKKYEGQE